MYLQAVEKRIRAGRWAACRASPSSRRRTLTSSRATLPWSGRPWRYSTRLSCKSILTVGSQGKASTWWWRSAIQVRMMMMVEENYLILGADTEKLERHIFRMYDSNKVRPNQRLVFWEIFWEIFQMIFPMYDSNKVGGRVMIGRTSNLLQFSFFTSLVCFTDGHDWVELTGNEMISSAVIWQIKKLLLLFSPIWGFHHPSHICVLANI